MMMMMMMMIVIFLLLLLLLIDCCYACIGSPNDTLHLVRSRVRAFATLSAQERIELESLLQPHTLAFLCGVDQVFTDPFDFAVDDESSSSIDSTTNAPFRLATDRRRWLSTLLPHYDASEHPRVAWLALSLRYWVEELHVTLPVAVELLWRVNEAKRAAQMWSPEKVQQYLTQCLVNCEDDDAVAFRANVQAALKDAPAGTVTAAAMCATRDDDALLRLLPSLTRWYDRRRLLRNMQVALPLPPRHFEGVARFVLLGLVRFAPSALPSPLVAHLLPLDEDLRQSTGEAYCWRTPDDLPPPDAPPLRTTLSALENDREQWEDEYDHAPDWRRAEMNQTLCPCSRADCGSCGSHGACLGDRCACVHTERTRFVGERCERVDACDAACENDGECVAEQCRCRALTFGERCEQRCSSVYNLTLCEAFNGVPFQRPHLLYRAEARVASALTLKCRDVAHALCADAVLVAKPCEREPLRIAFLLVVPDSDADRAALLAALDRLFAPAHLFAVLLSDANEARNVELRIAIQTRVAELALERADARLLRDETPQSRARGDAVYRANPLLFVQPTTRWVDGGFSMVQVVHDAAKQLFAHDANAYDFLVPLNVRSQANVAPIAKWEAILETRRDFSALDAVALGERRANELYFDANFYEHDGELHALNVTLPMPLDAVSTLFADDKPRFRRADGRSTSFRIVLHYGLVRLLAVEAAWTARLDTMFEFTRNAIDAYFHTALLGNRLRRRALSYAQLEQQLFE
jgi:hypothetical protein